MGELTLGFIGAGNMATAIISGIFKAKMPIKLIGYDLDEKKLDSLTVFGFNKVDSIAELSKTCNYLLLAVKPQNMAEVLAEVFGNISKNTVIISIAAGVTGSYISKALGFTAKVVQVMPNTPLMLSYGATALSKSADVSDDEFEFVRSIFDCAGRTEIIPQDKMNEIIPINGSSPAFIYQFAEYFVDYGKSVELNEDVCLRLFAQTLIGSAKMLTDSGYSIKELIKMVSSKGGTTIAGLEGFNENGLQDAVKSACEKCVKRAYELTV